MNEQANKNLQTQTTSTVVTRGEGAGGGDRAVKGKAIRIHGDERRYDCVW